MSVYQKKNFKTLILRKIKYLAFITLIYPLVFSCSKSSIPSLPGTTHLSVRMTDASANYDAVYVDIQGVEVTNDSLSPFALNTANGVYNLLDFANGADTLIATGDINGGLVSQIRLILGSNNSVKVNGVDYPLSTPSAQQSGLKLQIHKVFQPGVSYAIVLDFDALNSIVAEGNGNYILKPVIRTVDTAISGSMKGIVSPSDSLANVTASSLSDSTSYSTRTNSSGRFILGGIPGGTYNVTVTSLDTLLATIKLTNKTVTVGAVTDLGTIILPAR